METELSERQKEILRYVVCNFVYTAEPVASRTIARRHEMGLSAATIRNALADLEELGYVTHPHTSAGRVPTDKGYRFFVDWLMDVEPVTVTEAGHIKHLFDAASEPDDVFHAAAKVLGSISHQLSVVSAPHLSTSVLDHIELMAVSSTKILVILSVHSGLVRTITMEVAAEIPAEQLVVVSGILNERLCGLALETIRATFVERVKEVRDERTGLINLFIQAADKIFDDSRDREKVHIGGTQSLLEQPEYVKQENLREIIELISNEGVLVEALDRCMPQARGDGVAITIGGEHAEASLRNCSLIVAAYVVGDSGGTIGVIGPKRMNYAKVIPLVHLIAREVSSSLA